MRLNKPVFVIIAIILAAGSCVEPFVPEASNYLNTMFVEALLSDNPNLPHHVLLSRTVPIPTQESIGQQEEPANSDNISGANVTVHCDDGNIYQFYETVISKYYDTSNSLVLEAGKRYKLEIETQQGNLYESPYEIYQPSPIIDSISYDVRSVKPLETSEIEEGLRFYASTHRDDTDPIFTRYIMWETYKYSVPFHSEYIWKGQGDGGLEEFENDSLIYCYNTEYIKGIFSSTSEGLTANRIDKAPLHFVSQFGDKLMHRYSLLVYQLSINRSAYRFWNDLSRLLFETGGLYETQPFRISGNIICTTDPSINVMGVFEIAGVDTTRVFINSPRQFRVFPEFCAKDTVGVESFTWDEVSVGAYILTDESGNYFTSENRCFDCRERGGVTEPPPFWRQ